MTSRPKRKSHTKRTKILSSRQGHCNGFGLTAPHTPILPSVEFVGKSGANACGDFCLQIDALVGGLLGNLDRNGLSENTIVIFTSDNGGSPKADLPGLKALGQWSTHHFRGHKADIYGRRNLQAEHPEVVDHLKSLLTRYVLEGRSTPGPHQPNAGAPHWPGLWWIPPITQK